MADQPHMSPSQPQLSHPEDRFPNSLPSSTLSNAAIDAVPLSCVQDRDLPLPQDLRLRMRFLAAMEGMHGIISDEMVQLLQLGVEVLFK